MALQDRKKVLVVCNTDAIPKIIKALANVDIAQIPDDDYDNMYIIRLGKNKRLRKFTATTYGQLSP